MDKLGRGTGWAAGDHGPMSTTPLAASPRIAWADVPRHVRAAVEQELGSPVRSAIDAGRWLLTRRSRARRVRGRATRVREGSGPRVQPGQPRPASGRAARDVAAALTTCLPPRCWRPTTTATGWRSCSRTSTAGAPTCPGRASDVAAMSLALAQLARTEAPGQLPAFADIVSLLTSWDEVAADPEGIDHALLDRLAEMTAAQSLARRRHARRRPRALGRSGRQRAHPRTAARCCSTGPGPAVARHGWTACCWPWTSASRAAPTPTTSCGPVPCTRDVEPQHLRSVVVCMVGCLGRACPSPVAARTADDPRMAGALPRPRTSLGR